jgi:HK97 family phage prohead protease
MSKLEYRALPVGNVGATEGKITGLAAPFNSPTMIGDSAYGFREQFAPGAFTKTVQESDIVFLYNHDTGMPLSRQSAGTLSLRQTDRGLEFEAVPVDTSYGRDLTANIAAGNIKGCSFGFRSVKEDWTDDDGNPADEWTGTQRTVREAQLLEVSAVTFPAYGDTDISSRDAVTAARESRGGPKPVPEVVSAAPDGGTEARTDDVSDETSEPDITTRKIDPREYSFRLLGLENH